MPDDLELERPDPAQRLREGGRELLERAIHHGGAAPGVAVGGADLLPHHHRAHDAMGAIGDRRDAVLLAGDPFLGQQRESPGGGKPAGHHVGFLGRPHRLGVRHRALEHERSPHLLDGGLQLRPGRDQAGARHAEAARHDPRKAWLGRGGERGGGRHQGRDAGGREVLGQPGHDRHLDVDRGEQAVDARVAALLEQRPAPQRAFDLLDQLAVELLAAQHLTAVAAHDLGDEPRRQVGGVVDGA